MRPKKLLRNIQTNLLCLAKLAVVPCSILKQQFKKLTALKKPLIVIWKSRNLCQCSFMVILLI